jgi:hypothetical protein
VKGAKQNVIATNDYKLQFKHRTPFVIPCAAIESVAWLQMRTPSQFEMFGLTVAADTNACTVWAGATAAAGVTVAAGASSWRLDKRC